MMVVMVGVGDSYYRKNIMISNSSWSMVLGMVGRIFIMIFLSLTYLLTLNIIDYHFLPLV